MEGGLPACAQTGNLAQEKSETDMPEIPNHLPTGTFLRSDSYRIVRFIAAGGFGCTYEAEHILLEKRVAIKEFFMQDFCNRDTDGKYVTVVTQAKHGLVDKYKKKFIDEAKALSGLHHDGIVSVSDVFEENGTAYYVMDYVEGQSLGDLCKHGTLPEKHALYYIRQVCEALAYVHDHNRLHLDIKPANIMVESSGRTKLIDFGVSKQYDATTGENQSTTPGYTPGYAPLEQMNCNIKQFFPATDIYALGATLYRLLTGRIPSTPDIRLNEEENLTFPAGISAATRHAVEQALEIRKKDRPQSVREFMALLDAAVKPVPKPVPEPTPEPIPKPEPPVRRRKNLWPWIVGGLLALTAVVAGISNFGSKTKTDEITLDDLTVSGFENGHGYVDLGLSVKWATCNVGASTPESYGNYYAWGETSTKNEYTKDNSKTWERNMGDIGGNPGYDVARANWGGNWRLPTQAEFEELIDSCDRHCVAINGVVGMRFTSKKNGNSIFFPAAGWRSGTSTNFAGSDGDYWSSIIRPPGYPINIQYAQALWFSCDTYNGYVNTQGGVRSRGLSVRPVLE